MKTKLVLTLGVLLTTIKAHSQQTTAGSLFFNENRGFSASRNWVIRQNNTHEGDFQIGTGSTNTSPLPDLYGNPDFAKLTISNNGNVGIGTTSPIGQLQITGASGWDKSTRVYITNGASDYGRTNLILTGRMQSGNDAWIFGSDSRSSIVFASNYSASGLNVGTIGSEQFSIQHEQNSNSLGFLSQTKGNTPFLTMTQSGNVGIGTSSPDALLAVKGQVHAQEVKVSVTVPGPDYVFEKNYPLTSLEDIKTYIDQNKHLPEVPSAKEMEKNGIQLGEMNMLLLKKIEELTLYVIELKKENEEQQRLIVDDRNEIIKLKSKIK